MHEIHLVEGMVRSILEEAQKLKAGRVAQVFVVMGENSGFDEGSVKLYFESLGAGTPLENAAVSIRRVPTYLHCKTCQKDFPRQKGTLNCPACNQQGFPTKNGKELFVERFEIE